MHMELTMTNNIFSVINGCTPSECWIWHLPVPGFRATRPTPGCDVVPLQGTN